MYLTNHLPLLVREGRFFGETDKAHRMHVLGPAPVSFADYYTDELAINAMFSQSDFVPDGDAGWSEYEDEEKSASAFP